MGQIGSAWSVCGPDSPGVPDLAPGVGMAGGEGQLGPNLTLWDKRKCPGCVGR